MRKKVTQMGLFGEIPKVKVAKKGWSNSACAAVFHDYESFLAKFQNKEKTTDDCYTPKDVYEAVVRYVGTVVDLTDKVILRPFYPGGDYENEIYPENGIVIDNPPFSIVSKICKFYTDNNIPFFLFGPGLVILSTTKKSGCTAVIVGTSIVFDNKAVVKCNFASNLFGDLEIVTAPTLDEAIRNCASQKNNAPLPKRAYPDNLVTVSDLQTIAHGGVYFELKREEAARTEKIGKIDLFGGALITSTRKGEEKARAKMDNRQHIEFSDNEKRIVEMLDGFAEED